MFTINVYKWDDCWWFDDLEKDIKKEELVMGAPEFINNFIDRDKFNLIFSDDEFENFDFKLTYKGFEESGHIYIFEDHEIWLCSVLLKYFQLPPNNLYLKIL